MMSTVQVFYFIWNSSLCLFLQFFIDLSQKWGLERFARPHTSRPLHLRCQLYFPCASEKGCKVYRIPSHGKLAWRTFGIRMCMRDVMRCCQLLCALREFACVAEEMLDFYLHRMYAYCVGMHTVAVALPPPLLPQVDSEEMVDFWDEMLHISMWVKELPPSLLQSGTEEEEEMMFFSLWSEMMSSVSRNTSRPRKIHT